MIHAIICSILKDLAGLWWFEFMLSCRCWFNSPALALRRFFGNWAVGHHWDPLYPQWLFSSSNSCLIVWFNPGEGKQTHSQVFEYVITNHCTYSRSAAEQHFNKSLVSVGGCGFKQIWMWHWPSLLDIYIHSVSLWCNRRSNKTSTFRSALPTTHNHGITHSRTLTAGLAVT